MGHRRHLSSLQRWDYYFDQGNAQSVAEENGKIRITPYGYTTTNTWLLFSIRSDRLGGKTPHFLVAKANRYGGVPATTENMAVWSNSPDTDTWYKFDNQSIGTTDIEFYNNQPFPNGTIYIAYLPLYPWARSERLFREWIKDSRVTINNYGQDTRRPCRDGRVAPSLPYLALTVTNDSGYTKKNLMINAGTHPNETEGPYQLEGAMSWLLGGSAEAEFLLDYFNVYVYPRSNPQGAWAGYTRSGPQHYDNWHGDYTDPPTFGVYYDDIDAQNAKMEADTSTTAEVGIDFHGTVSNFLGYIDTPDHTTVINARFLALMQGYQSAFTYVDETLGYTLPDIWRTNYSAAFAAHLEGGARATIAIPSTWKAQGQYTLQAITKMLAEGRFANGPTVGSRDFNGTTDRIDWANVYNPKGTATTISMWLYYDTSTVTDYFFNMGDGNTYGFWLGTGAATGVLQIAINGTSFMARITTQAGITAGSWKHLLATYTGTFGAYTNLKLFVNGVEGPYDNPNSVNGSGTETEHTGTWSLGGRLVDDLRNTDGKMAQVAVWNRVLNSTEIAQLAAGYAPDLVDGGSNLKFYFKGDTSSLVASPGGTGTADGTTYISGLGNGPGIIYA